MSYASMKFGGSETGHLGIAGLHELYRQNISQLLNSGTPMLKPSRIVAKQATLVADKRGVRILSPADILGLYRDNGKENGNYESVLGFYWDNGKENGNYYSILRLKRDNEKRYGHYYSMLGLYKDKGEENGNYHTIVYVETESLGGLLRGFRSWQSPAVDGGSLARARLKLLVTSNVPKD